MRRRHEEAPELQEQRERHSKARHDHQSGPPASRALLAVLIVGLLVSASLATEEQPAEQVAAGDARLEALPEARASPLRQLAQPFASGQGIVVAKRPALIAGLNQQFKNRQGIVQTSSNSSSQAPPSSTLGNLWAAGVQLVGLGPSNPRRQQQHQPSLNRRSAAGSDVAPIGPSSSGPQSVSGQAEHQQPDGGRASSAPAADAKQLKWSEGGPAAAHNHNRNHNYDHDHLAPQQRSAVAPGEPGNATGSQPGPQAQLYKGYSLIELEVRSEPDRRFVQELYGNLSAALTELAQRPAGASVSPYVDIDFWSFKCALNDHIDIMVSPKSRSFVLGQLSRAKIKHRVKIDDIQARLDAQQLAPAPGAPAAAGGELSGRQQQVGAGADQPQTGEPPLPQHQHQAPLNDSAFFDNYQRVADINQYLESLVARARDVAQVQVIGRSSQGRYLRVLRLGYEQRDVDGSTRTEPEPAAPGPAEPSAPPQPGNASRIVDQFIRGQQDVRKLGAIWLDGGTHAREWISPATVLYIAFRLTDNHAKCLAFFDHLREAAAGRATGRSLAGPGAQLDADLLNGINHIQGSLLDGPPKQARARSQLEQRLELLAKRPQELAGEHACDLELEQLLRRYTFYAMPVLNPDGYEYSHTHNRLWRKTRSTSLHPIYRHFCLGADPNRNYDARHGSTGSSGHPCSQTYGGATPFTEPETRHQSNFVYAHRAALKMFVSFHSYSQMILLPYSHSKHLAPDHKDLESVGQAAVRAIERTHGTQYRVGPSASILYTASGTASDWAYEKAGIKYSYTIELRDTGAFGFLLPRQQIVPTGEETFNGLLAMIGQMEKNDRLLSSKSGPPAPPNDTAKLLHQADLAHAPDLDLLRPFGRFRPRPAQLENALDGSDTWATPGPAAPGVRDRGPAEPSELEGAPGSDEEPDAGFVFEGEGELMEPTGLELAGQQRHQVGRRQLDQQAHLYGLVHASRQRLADPDEPEPVGGQPADGGRRAAGAAHAPANARALPASMALSANGRTLINSPPPPDRATPGQTRRESSDGQRLAVH